MSEIKIPPAALEAGARAAYDQWRHECADEGDEPVENYREWDDLDEWEQDSFRAQARACCLAMIEAWPGMEYVFRQPTRYSVCYSKPAIILPLPPQETSDD